jgi:hypothetical protein
MRRGTARSSVLCGTVGFAFLLVADRRAAAVSLDETGLLKPPTLTSVTCQIHPGGLTVHVIKGTFPGLRPAGGANPNDVPVTVEGDWDPVKKEATEIVSWTGDIGIRPMPADNERWGRGRMSCPSDPWENAVHCTLVTSELFYGKLSTGTFPVTERFLTPRIRAEIANACRHPVPLKQPKPTPDPRLLASNAQLVQPCKVCTGAPYGATYSGGSPGTLKPGTMISVPVTVTNTGCLEWAGQSATFHLSNHWYSGTQPVTFDGLRTVLPRRVCPGETVQMMGSLKAPSTPGTYVLKWDMVQEGVTWFSSKGVATHDVTVTVQ